MPLSTQGKILLTGLGVAVIGVTAAIFYSKHKQAALEANAPDEKTMGKTPVFVPGVSTPVYVAPVTASTFPLNVGMVGPLVKSLQQGLINMGIPVVYGADGNFGAKTLAAVQQAGYSAPVSQADYNSIVAGVKKASASQIAAQKDIVDAQNKLILGSWESAPDSSTADSSTASAVSPSLFQSLLMV